MDASEEDTVEVEDPKSTMTSEQRTTSDAENGPVELPPPNQVKIMAMRRLKALECRKKTVGTHLDELRALLTLLFELLPD